MTAPASRASAAMSLPPELLTMILAPLPHDILMTAAAVCSWWRATAVQQPMYYRRCAFILPESIGRWLHCGPQCADINRLDRIIAESQTNGYTLGLEVHIELAMVGATATQTTADEDYDKDSFPSAESVVALLHETILPVLRRALARCVVLDLDPDLESAALLLNGLTAPAPLLRFLNVSVGPRQTFEERPERYPLPPDFLCAHAPRLMTLSLYKGHVSSTSPCFPSVVTLNYDCCHEQPPRLSEVRACFPNLRQLTLSHLLYYHDVLPEDYVLFRGLDTLCLGSSAIDDDEFPLDQLVPALQANPDIPYIKSRNRALEPLAALIPTSGDIQLHLVEILMSEFAVFDDYNQMSRLRVEFRSGGLTRCLAADGPFSDAFKLLEHASRSVDLVTELDIDDRHLRTFMQKRKHMPCLTTLRITLISWTTLLPGTSITPDEEVLYAVHPVRNNCSCLRGMFADAVDERYPAGDVDIDWPSLETIELRSSRRGSTVSADVLRGLAQSFGSGRQLILSNGLIPAPDSDVATLFSEVSCPDREFCSSLSCVARAAGILVFAAISKADEVQQLDEALRTHGPDFHWADCPEAQTSASSDSEDGGEPDGNGQ